MGASSGNILIKEISIGVRCKDLKKIEAVISLSKLDGVVAALKEVGVGGFTIYNTVGRGQITRPERVSARGTSVYTPEFNANSMIVIVLKDSMVDKVVEKITNSASTGLAGEGKIFISEIRDAVDVGSKEHGDSTV
jgi:nitrogen regulatory protein P-II 1